MNYRALLTGAAIALASAYPSFGAIIEFNSRPAWQLAAGTIVGSEDFNSFGADTPYGPGSSLSLSGGMTLGSLGSTGENTIDLPPYQTSESNVDGTASARAFNNFTPFFTFSTPIGAFGADFSAFQDDILRTQVEVYDGASLIATLTPSILPSGVRFYGFAANAGEQFTEIRFVSVNSDVFGIDNIEIGSTASVPEPSAVSLLALGLIGLGWRRRRRNGI